MTHEIRVISFAMGEGHCYIGRLTHIIDTHDHIGRSMGQKFEKDIGLSARKANEKVKDLFLSDMLPLRLPFLGQSIVVKRVIDPVHRVLKDIPPNIRDQGIMSLFPNSVVT